jgi:hypothetical protein
MLKRSIETTRAIGKSRTASLPERPGRRRKPRLGNRRRVSEALTAANAGGGRSANRFPR